MVKALALKKEGLIILLDFTILEKKILVFLEIMEKWSLMQPANQKNETKAKGFKVLTPK